MHIINLLQTARVFNASGSINRGREHAASMSVCPSVTAIWTFLIYFDKLIEPWHLIYSFICIVLEITAVQQNNRHLNYKQTKPSHVRLPVNVCCVSCGWGTDQRVAVVLLLPFTVKGKLFTLHLPCTVLVTNSWNWFLPRVRCRYVSVDIFILYHMGLTFLFERKWICKVVNRFYGLMGLMPNKNK